jgi:SAM-dependent methyltransferase
MDIGAGNGDLSKLLCEKFPHSFGIAVDFHEIPEALSGVRNLKWMQVDLNDRNFSRFLADNKADMIFSISVLEHVLDPKNFVQNLLLLLPQHAILYLAAPDFDSPSRRLMGKRWPYLIPGEHLHIPTLKAMKSVCSLAIQESGAAGPAARAFSNHVSLHYPIQFFFNYFQVGFLNRWFPHTKFFLPVRVLEGGIIL